MLDSFIKKFILKDNKPKQGNSMQVEQDIAIDDLKYNFKIYFCKLIKAFLDAENYDDLAEYLYHCIERFQDKNVFGLAPEDKLNLGNLVVTMRGRKYTWFESVDDGENTRKNLKTNIILKDTKILISYCEAFLERNKSLIEQGITIGKTVNNFATMFDLDENEKVIMQFLLDCEMSCESEQMVVNYGGLFSWYDTKHIFKSNIYKILSVFAKPVPKNFDLKGIIQKKERAPFRNCSGYCSEDAITPYWPKIPKIYIDAIVEDNEITFDNIANRFKDNFKKKLSYTDFSNLPQTPVVEKLINQSLYENSVGVNVLFYGLPGTGKTEMVHALAEQNNWKLIVIGEEDGLTPYDRLINLSFAQKFFSNFKHEPIVFLFDEMEDVLRIKPEDMGKNQINRIIENSPFPIFWTSNNVHRFEQSFLRRMTYASKFDIPNKKRRKEIWNKFSDQHNLNLGGSVIENYAQAYHTSPSVIGNVSEIASKVNLQVDETKLVIEDLLTAYNHGQQVSASKDSYIGAYSAYDFELSNTDTDLTMLIDKLRTSGCTNFNACLYGPPGTGKSALGRHLAEQIGMKVVYKKASDLISMWVGESEKNIARAFQEAHEDEALLIFDEADSFLNSRAEAKQSWQITQVNEMLTQMENSRYPFICTTNIIENLDEASMRRFVFKIKFDWLTTDQINAAFKKFFDLDVSVPRNWKLSPGDFVSVKKRANILGTTDKTEIYNLMKTEFELKKLDGSKSIGFLK